MAAKVSGEVRSLFEKSGLFDAKWYLETYPDVAVIGMDPIEHYLSFGHRLGRNPSPRFSVRAYLETYPDIVRLKIEPLTHYLRAGRKENRVIYPVDHEVDRDAKTRCDRLISRRVDRLDPAPLRLIRSADVSTDSLKVSIVMPTKNRAGLIGAAIASAKAQTHPNWELLIVDDGSTDDTAAVIAAADDPRISFFPNDRGQGVSAARNAGLDRATGDWIFFLDSDNEWKPDYLETMLRFTAHQRLNAAYCAARILDDDRREKGILYADFDYETCLEENFIDINTFCVARALAHIRFDPTLRRLVDWDYILRVGAHTPIRGLPYVGVDYYDGKAAPRITTTEHVGGGEIHKLLGAIRSKAKAYLTSAEPIEPPNRIAVVFHVFHDDVVGICLDRIAMIREPFDLFVTTSHPKDHPVLNSIRDRFPLASIMFYPNIGSDIAPFLNLISSLKNYETVCKIHTKRNAGKWGSAWRTLLLDGILPSPDEASMVISRFRQNPHLAMVASRDMFLAGAPNSIKPTLEHARSLSIETGLGDPFDRKWSFVAGTMFWIRPQCLLDLARVMRESPGYSVHFRQDGAIEHGLERMFGLSVFKCADPQVGLFSEQDGRLTYEEIPAGSAFRPEGISKILNQFVADHPEAVM